jgi:dGTP triphosphohydrolase
MSALMAKRLASISRVGDGHTPFGHAGEYALGACLPGGFRHNEQSVRVVELLEKEGKGLNLTREVRDGILRHSKLRESIAAEVGALPTPYSKVAGQRARKLGDGGL